MGMLDFVKEAGEKLFHIGQGKAASAAPAPGQQSAPAASGGDAEAADASPGQKLRIPSQ